MRRKPLWSLACLALLSLPFWFRLPAPLFDAPLATVLEDRSGQLLGARIADDGQWRFPAMDSVPTYFSEALISFEDKRFYQHRGVDLKAFGRALAQNIRAGRIVSGGSTLSMQVVRLARLNPPRTLWQKGIEMILALKLEMRYSKEEILALYASHAPFGGNVVGLEAASWRYFGKAPEYLSRSEAATLAVLPNRPGLIYPGRNRDLLREKRDRLLDRMLERGLLDSLNRSLAGSEPLPGAPYTLPSLAPHLLQRARQEGAAGGRVRSSLQATLQKQVAEIVTRHHRNMRGRQVNNMAALILDVESGRALAYVGNAPLAAEAGSVDLVTARRSTGSILKPFLYAHALHEGNILPESLLRDVPASFDNFQPRNFHRGHDGLVPARQALQRSLNVPMVYLLQDYGLEKFHAALLELGLTTLDREPSHYGLSLILGGAEATLWDLAGAYGSMARVLSHHYDLYGQYDTGDLRPAGYLAMQGASEGPSGQLSREAPWLDAGSIWETFRAMQELERPAGEERWQRFSSSRNMAWKTGTSFGFRDAWAIGVDPDYVVAVWVGNADGEGRPGLTGIEAAAPLLFDLTDLLPAVSWFAEPLDELAPIPVCRNSGFRAMPHCPADTVMVPRTGVRAPACPYHRMVHLTVDGKWQANRDCASGHELLTLPWFDLPPREEYYYRTRHPGYRVLPPLHPNCRAQALDEARSPMQLIFPHEPTRILVPVDLDGSKSETVFRLAHRFAETRVFWHLDDKFLGETRHFHEMALDPAPGVHRLVLVDEDGNRLEQEIEFLGQ